jgi:hypothetical protein
MQRASTQVLTQDDGQHWATIQIGVNNRPEHPFRCIQPTSDAAHDACIDRSRVWRDEPTKCVTLRAALEQLVDACPTF